MTYPRGGSRGRPSALLLLVFEVIEGMRGVRRRRRSFHIAYVWDGRWQWGLERLNHFTG